MQQAEQEPLHDPLGRGLVRTACGDRSHQRPAAAAPRGPLNHDRLMEASHTRLSAAADSDVEHEALVAARILDNPRDFGRWESQHAGIMTRVIVERFRDAQRYELLNQALVLVHRKALFEYLRDNAVRGNERVRLIRHFFQHREYSRAIVTEHTNYLHSAASYMCSTHVGTRVLLDEVFDDPLFQYEQLYSEYFRVHCNLVANPDSNASIVLAPMLGTLRRQVADWRQALIALAHSRSGIWRTPVELLRRLQQGDGG